MPLVSFSVFSVFCGKPACGTVVQFPGYDTGVAVREGINGGACLSREQVIATKQQRIIEPRRWRGVRDVDPERRPDLPARAAVQLSSKACYCSIVLLRWGVLLLQLLQSAKDQKNAQRKSYHKVEGKC